MVGQETITLFAVSTASGALLFVAFYQRGSALRARKIATRKIMYHSSTDDDILMGLRSGSLPITGYTSTRKDHDIKIRGLYEHNHRRIKFIGPKTVVPFLSLYSYSQVQNHCMSNLFTISPHQSFNPIMHPPPPSASNAHIEATSD